MRDVLRGLWLVLMTSRPVLWLHDRWHGGRPCQRAVRQLLDDDWMRSAMRSAMHGTSPSDPGRPLP